MNNEHTKSLEEKESLSEYTDRELLLTILANQVTLSRKLDYLEQIVRNGKTDSLGADYTKSVWELTRSNEKILEDYDKYLSGEVAD